ncbi:MAG: hypothetical protein AAFQ09_02130 [Pseudomonadota bacterium]
MAFQIIRHAFSMIFGNFGQALRVSLVPFGVLVGAFLLVMLAWDDRLEQMGRGLDEELIGPAASAADLLAILGLIALFLFVFSWVAVSWHRFILLEEYSGVVPAVSDRPILPYLLRSLLYALVLLVVSIPVLLISSFLLVPFFESGLELIGNIIMLIASAVMTYVWLRIGLALPSVAVGQPISIRQAWAASAPLSGTIFQVAFLLMVINSAAVFLSDPMYAVGWVFGVAVDLFTQWLVIMLGVSILTTLYGHLIEKRALIS